MKELGGKTGVLVGLDLPSASGGTEAGGLIPTLGLLSESEEKHLRLRVKQQICGRLNGMKIRQSFLALAVHITNRDADPLEDAAAESWSLGKVEQSQGEGCC